MDAITIRLFLFGLPLLALVWPIIALTLRGRRAWRPWGAGGCFLLGAVMTAVGTWMAADTPHFFFAWLYAVPFWLLGVFNLVAATGVVLSRIPPHRILLPLDPEARDQGRVDGVWSWRATVVVVAMVAVFTWAGTVWGTWPRLPEPSPPQEGQITGVVGDPMLYGWRRLEPHRRFDVVVAVPDGSFDLFRALDVRRVHVGTPEPPVLYLQLPQDDLLDIDGVRLALIPGDAFTLDGLSADVSYWICVGSATDGNRWSFATCDRPELEIPGQVRIAHAHPSVDGAVIAPLR